MSMVYANDMVLDSTSVMVTHECEGPCPHRSSIMTFFDMYVGTCDSPDDCTSAAHVHALSTPVGPIITSNDTGLSQLIT